jgi:hypothetical protein
MSNYISTISDQVTRLSERDDSSIKADIVDLGNLMSSHICFRMPALELKKKGWKPTSYL